MKLTPKTLDKLIILFGFITIAWFSTILIHMHIDYMKLKNDASIIITTQDHIISNQDHIINNQTNIISNQSHIISNQNYYMSNTLDIFHILPTK